MDTGILFTVMLKTFNDDGLLINTYNFNVFVDANDCLNISVDEEEIDVDIMEEMAIKYAIDKFYDQGNVLRRGEIIEVVSVRY